MRLLQTKIKSWKKRWNLDKKVFFKQENQCFQRKFPNEPENWHRTAFVGGSDRRKMRGLHKGGAYGPFCKREFEESEKEGLRVGVENSYQNRRVDRQKNV